MVTDMKPLDHSARLYLFPVSSVDVGDIQRYAADRAIADTMISVPHPYPAGEAERYVEQHSADMTRRRSFTFVLREREGKNFAGIIELRAIDNEHAQGELSFWLARPAWGRGYMREALPVVVTFAFDRVGLNRLYAYHMLRNPGSGRVLEKTGFRQEGLLRQRVRKWGVFEDVALWARLRDDG